MAGPGAANGAKEKKRVLTKNEKKRLKKKAEREEKRLAEANGAGGAVEEAKAALEASSSSSASNGNGAAGEEKVTVEYVSANYDADAASALFADVFAKFASAEVLTSDAAPAAEGGDEAPAGGGGANSGGGAEEEAVAEEKELSKKQRKAMSRMTVAELKQMVAKPEVVEAHEVTAGDPKLLVYLKSYRNAVPVPRHWCHKRKYLQGKRGVEKKPWQLPEFIAQTGASPRRLSLRACDKKGRGRKRDFQTVIPV